MPTNPIDLTNRVFGMLTARSGRRRRLIQRDLSRGIGGFLWGGSPVPPFLSTDWRYVLPKAKVPTLNGDVVTPVDVTNDDQVKHHVKGHLLRGLNIAEEAAINDIVELREAVTSEKKRQPRLKNSLARFLALHLGYGRELNIHGEVDNDRLITIEAEPY
jgi:hypothetical protein